MEELHFQATLKSRMIFDISFITLQYDVQGVIQ